MNRCPHYPYGCMHDCGIHGCLLAATRPQADPFFAPVEWSERNPVQPYPPKLAVTCLRATVLAMWIGLTLAALLLGALLVAALVKGMA